MDMIAYPCPKFKASFANTTKNVLEPGIHFTNSLWTHNSYVHNNTCYSYMKSYYPIRSQFCTSLDSSAVMGCAKLRHDWIIRNRDFNHKLIKRLWNDSLDPPWKATIFRASDSISVDQPSMLAPDDSQPYQRWVPWPQWPSTLKVMSILSEKSLHPGCWSESKAFNKRILSAYS